MKSQAATLTQEGAQYDYYKNLIADKDPNSGYAELVKKLSNGTGSADYWWLRSPIVTSTAGFWCIGSSGGASSYLASDAYGVSFGFCV